MKLGGKGPERGDRGAGCVGPGVKGGCSCARRAGALRQGSRTSCCASRRRQVAGWVGEVEIPNEIKKQALMKGVRAVVLPAVVLQAASKTPSVA